MDFPSKMKTARILKEHHWIRMEARLDQSPTRWSWRAAQEERDGCRSLLLLPLDSKYAESIGVILTCLPQQKCFYEWTCASGCRLQQLPLPTGAFQLSPPEKQFLKAEVLCSYHGQKLLMDLSSSMNLTSIFLKNNNTKLCILD